MHARQIGERIEMATSLIERQVENAVQEMFDDRAVRLVRGLRRMAAKQGGESTIQNYQLLGKRALIAVGAFIVVAEVVTSTVGYVVSRRNEEQRIERVVRRMLEEERQAVESGQAAESEA